ncbi:hypothetical protein RvY_09072 [Ramazzottius varieornatus]|uniref:Uncharacterized protein n=1 Tax=Ramazzottius varieornatus TaxID=947166 RepID=A0A1D1VG11_RAMVA|nr:hypothetical protein RvY_09072 [Ramazzottius varieornatus]
MANDMDTKKPLDVIQRTASSVLEPVRELCTSIKEFSDMVTSRLPTDDQIWDAKRKNELPKRQIIAVRQVEQRIEIDQNSIQMIRGRLVGLENEVQSLYDKAEATDYEVILFEQKIPSLKNLLASKFGIGTNTLPVAGSDNPDSSKVSFLPEVSVNTSLLPSSLSAIVTPPPSAQQRSKLRPPGSVSRKPEPYQASAQKPHSKPLSFHPQYAPSHNHKEEAYTNRYQDFGDHSQNNGQLSSGLKFRPHPYNGSHIPPPLNQNNRETLSANPFGSTRNMQFTPNYPNLAASTSNLSSSYNSPQQQSKEMFHGPNTSVQMSSSSRIPSSYVPQSASRQNGQGPSMSGSFISSAFRAPVSHHQSTSSLPQYSSSHNNLQTSRISPIRNMPRSELDEIDDLMQRLKGNQVRRAY